MSIPLVTTNRINTPEIANEIIKGGHADMVSMARPMLADPDFMVKAKAGKSDEINTCIGCNQACLDHVFKGNIASCLVNLMRVTKLSLCQKKYYSKKSRGHWCMAIRDFMRD